MSDIVVFPDGLPRDYWWKKAKEVVKQWFLPLVLIIIWSILISVLWQLYGTPGIYGEVQPPIRVSIINFLFSLWYGFGLANAGITTVRGEKVSVDTVFGYSWKDFGRMFAWNIMLFLWGVAFAVISIFIVFVWVFTTGKQSDLSITDVESFMALLSGFGFWFLGLFILVCLLLFLFRFVVRISRWMYALADKPSLSGLQALKYTWRITKGHFWEVFGINFVFGLLQILWVLALLVGLFWTIPMLYIGTAYAYKAYAKAYDEKQVSLSSEHTV